MAVYNQDSLVGTGIALPALATIVLCLRFYVRLRLRRTYIGIDDWLILLSVILVCGHGVIQVLGVYYAVGGQDDVLPESRSKKALAYGQKLSKAIVLIEKFTYCFIKLSVLFLYRRIFGASQKFCRVTNVLIGLIITWAIFFIFLESFICVSGSSSSSTCTAQEWALLWFSITEVIGDMLILSLPFPMIRRLQMSRRDKIGLSAIFAMGTLSTIIGFVRLGYVVKNFHTFFHPEFHNKTGSAPGFWTTVQVSVGVIAACLPPLSPLLRRAPGPKKAFRSLRDRMLSIRSRHKRSDSNRPMIDREHDPQTGEGVVVHVDKQQDLKFEKGDAQLAHVPVIPFTLPRSPRISLIPAAFRSNNGSYVSMATGESYPG